MTTPSTSVLIIYTGGTIGMTQNPVTGSLEPFDFNHLLDNVPELRRLGYSVSTMQFDPIIDSSETEPSQWAKIVQVIAENYEKYDGFVVLHGTDTMAYTASAVSFMLENLGKPVIFTGSPSACCAQMAKKTSSQPLRLLPTKTSKDDLAYPKYVSSLTTLLCVATALAR